MKTSVRMSLVLAGSLLASGVTCASLLAQEPLTPGPLQPPPQASGSPSPAPQAQPAPVLTPRTERTDSIEVPTGTKLPLVLHNAITTRNAQPGDPVYLETTFPVVIDSRILVPAGSYVQGEIIDAKRPGKVKGQGEVRIRLTTLILPNGYTTRFDAIPTNTGTGGGETTDKEGNIKGDTDRTTDVGTVMKTTGVGAGIGAIAGRSGAGAGIGAGVGAAVGLAAVLLTRGPELELPRGTSVDIVLDRPLYLDASKVNFTDPGHSTALPGPASREPVRSRSPL
jgi:type IV secretion system protein VirB10